MPYHTVVQDSIRQWGVGGILAVQVLADHLDMSLLPHLLSRFHPKADVASAITCKQITNDNTPKIHHEKDACPGSFQTR